MRNQRKLKNLCNTILVCVQIRAACKTNNAFTYTNNDSVFGWYVVYSRAMYDIIPVYMKQQGQGLYVTEPMRELLSALRRYSVFRRCIFRYLKKLYTSSEVTCRRRLIRFFVARRILYDGRFISGLFRDLSLSPSFDPRTTPSTKTN